MFEDFFCIMDNLFSASRHDANLPLADAVRPKVIDEIIGQNHIISAGKPLRRRIETGRLGSVILFGSPGIGKTTIARIIGQTMNKEFISLHAAGLSVNDIKKVSEDAKFKPTLIFIDEIHRLNAGQQDYLLENSEKGAFDMISATSHNPYHNLSPALCSRSTIFELRILDYEEVLLVIDRGLQYLSKQNINITFEPEAKELLARKSGGDARRSLSTLESVVMGYSGDIKITIEMVEEVLEAAPVTYDRKGDAHYDVISAFVKSMRGGDADATLYWLAVLLHAGEDPRYIARRLVIHASEDIGLADNSALQTATSAYLAVEKIGMPEGRIILAHAALHICRAPKSNSAYRGISKALEYVRNNSIMPVPSYLRDTHYEGAAPLGRGGYKSPHSSELGWIDQEYAPGIGVGDFYKSDARLGNTFEARSDGYWESLKGKISPRNWIKR